MPVLFVHTGNSACTGWGFNDCVADEWMNEWMNSAFADNIHSLPSPATPDEHIPS
jgi:hypothetical protein